MRRAITAIEMVTTLVVLGVVLALIARTATSHERLQRTLAASRNNSRAVVQTTEIFAAALATISAEDLDRTQATDSAVEFQLLVGTALGCVAGASVHIGADRVGAALSAFYGSVQVGDGVLALDVTQRHPRWIQSHVEFVGAGGSTCTVAASAEGQTVRLDAPVSGMTLTAFRFTRRVRLSLYRGGDRAWYLGFRDWNAATLRFNTVQPVAGPLAAYAAGAGNSGLRFSFLDSAGRDLSLPLVAGATVRAIRAAARSEDGADSAQRTVALRDAP
ncbi:MAG TPA: hypothetical protein VIJ16_01555, partial [Gemmatimonadaceae bacterium]